MIFLALGIVVTLTQFRVPIGIRIAALAGLLVLVAMTLWMTVALRHGAFVVMLDWLGRFRPLRALRRFRHQAERLDVLIGDFYERRQEHFLESVAWSFLGWCGGLLETYLLLRLIAPGEGWRTAVAIRVARAGAQQRRASHPGTPRDRRGRARRRLPVLLGLGREGAAYGVARRARAPLADSGLVVPLKHHLLDLRHWHLSEVRLDEEARGPGVAPWRAAGGRAMRARS